MIKTQDSHWWRGEEWEREFSLKFHQLGLPLLVSPLVLRSRGAGQIDLARLEKRKGQWWIKMVETKTHPLISSLQRRRLRKSAQFLSALFGYPVDQVYHIKLKRDFAK
jgi:hypothetical protein